MPPSSSDSCVSLIVPHITFSQELAVCRRSVLARLAGRGAVSAVQSDEQPARAFALWELALLRTCGLRVDANAFPSAALCRLGQTANFDQHTWAHLEAVHLAASLNDVAATRLDGVCGMTPEEYARLTATLIEHLTLDNYMLERHDETGWLLQLKHALKAITTAPEHAFRGPLKQSLPAGEHGAELRRLMTEIQMLLHEHPVNQARERAGLPAINAVWLWGLGLVPSRIDAATSLPKAYGQRDFLKGLYLIHGETVHAERFTANSLLESVPHDTVAVVEVQEAEALDTLWLEPLAREMRGGAIRRLHVWLDCGRITVTRGELLRFWRKPRAPAQWST